MSIDANSSQDATGGQPDWAALRAQFPLLGNCAYLDLGRKAASNLRTASGTCLV